jgi:hypothetical protein
MLEFGKRLQPNGHKVSPCPYRYAVPLKRYRKALDEHVPGSVLFNEAGKLLDNPGLIPS